MPAAAPAMPELRGLTPLGNLLHFMRDPPDFCRRAAAAGDLVRLRLPGESPIALHSPELIDQVLVGKNRSFIKDRLTRGLAEVVGNGLLVSDGDFWRRQRRLAQPAFHRERIVRHAASMVAAAERMIATWHEGQVLDVHAAMMGLAREVVATTLLSTEVGRRAEDLGEALEVLMARYSDPRHSFFPGFARLPYTEAVVLETMRLYPPAWSIGREAIEDVEVGGVVLPRGTQVWMFQWTTHRDERTFHRPLAFEPERWLDGLQHRLPRFAYFPFGGGPRLCIGHNFAMLEAVLLLATIARRWRPQVAQKDVPRPQFSITLRPRGGVRATLHRHRPAPA